MQQHELFNPSQRPVTIDDLEALGKEIEKKREEVKAKKKIYSEANEELELLEQRVLGVLKEAGKKSYTTEVGRITRVEQFRVSLPKGPEEWEKFFAYAKEKGVYEELITVNSNTLNSFYMQEWDNVKKNGLPEDALSFSIPGIEEPKVRETISFTKK